MLSFIRSPRLSIRSRKTRLHLVSDKTVEMTLKMIKVIGDGTV